MRFSYILRALHAARSAPTIMLHKQNLKNAPLAILQSSFLIGWTRSVFVAGAVAMAGPQVFGQTASPTYTVVIETVTTSFEENKRVTPTARFGHNVDSDVDVLLDYQINGQDCPEDNNLPNRIDEIVLLEDGVRVDSDEPCDPKAQGTLSYRPTTPGAKVLTVVARLGNGEEVRSGGVLVQMFGVSLQTALGDTITTPFLPFTSRIFLEANALLADANVKKAQFFHRNLPFELSSNVPYSVADKVVSGGRVFVVEEVTGSGVIPAGGTRTLKGENDQDRDTIRDITFRYAGPRVVSGIDYYNLRISDEPSVNVPASRGPPRGRVDLVIIGDDVYENIVAGTVVSGATPVVTNGGRDARFNGIISFAFAGSELARSTAYRRGDLVLSNGRIYEAVQDGTTPGNLGLGLLQTDGQVQVIGSTAFNFIPSKVLKEQLPYWQDDLVISNRRIYRVLNLGTIRADRLGNGLTSLGVEAKATLVQFRRVPEETVLTNDQRTIRRFDSGATVVPQYHKYTEIDADYAGVPLQQGVVYHAGDVVVSNDNLYEVATGGTMGPVGAGLTSPGTQTRGGLTFKFLGRFYKQISKIRAQQLAAGASYEVGERVVSNGRVYEITAVPTPYTALTASEVAAGLTSTAGTQRLGGFSFVYTSQPFVDVPFPYSRFDYSFPYTVKWSPAETISNHYSWFGRSGYFEDFSAIELFTRITDSKDRTNTSGTIPVSILPPIDARASLATFITTPTNDRVVAAGTPVQITAESKDANGVVRFVQSTQFFIDGVPLYSPDVSFPYTTEEPSHWTPTIAGTYLLNALTIDDKGNFTLSPDVRVNVTDNQPFVRITSPNAPDPLNPFLISPGATITLEGVVSGSGGDPGRVETVELFSDGNSLGTATLEGGRFSFDFAPTNASDSLINYQITARVLDQNGATASSNTVYIRVEGIPFPTPPPVGTTIIQFHQALFSAPSTEDSISLTVDLSRAAGDNGPISVDYATSNGSAKAGQDYQAETGTLIFTGFQTQQTITISITPQNNPGADRNFFVTLSNPSRGTLGRSMATAVITHPDLSTKLFNISTRAPVQTGDGVMIAGFIIQGESPKKLALRGIGPSLMARGVPNAIDDPAVTLMDSNGAQIAFNDDYQTNSTDDQETLEENELSPQDSRESAIVATVAPGNYTAILRGKTNGVALVEAYDISSTATSRLVNISTRSKVERGDNGAMIAGFIIAAPSNLPGTAQRVVIRALGPSLEEAGVMDALQDPTLEIYRGSQKILENDDWESDQEEELSQSGVAPQNNQEAAIITSLEPGSYTAVLRGKGDTTGVALAEVYQLNQ